MRLKIITIILFFAIPLSSQVDNNNTNTFDKPTAIETPKQTIKVNTIQPLGFLINNKAGKGFDLQYERPINTKFWKNKYGSNAKGEPRYTSINIRGFYSLLYSKNQHEATLTKSYEKIGGSVMIKRYKNADLSGRFIGFSVTAASLIYRDIYEFYEKDESSHGFFGGFGVAWGKTYRRGKWSIEPVLQIGVGFMTIEGDVRKPVTGGSPYAPLAGASRFGEQMLKVFSNSYFAINVGYDL